MLETRLLTEAEVAVILRCKPRNVRRLRELGRLRYLPGRPPKVDEADLRAYVDANKVQVKPEAKPSEAPALTDVELAEIKARATKAWERRHQRESKKA